MKISFFLLALLALSLSPLSRAADAVDATKAIEKFKYFGCIGCHSVKSAGLAIDESKKESDDKADKDDKTPNPPDLSGEGKKHDAEWISAYLKKKEKIEGREHKKIFKGDKDERNLLAGWIGSLKSEEAKAAAPAAKKTKK